MSDLVKRLRASAYWMSGSADGHEGENDVPLIAAYRIEALEDALREASAKTLSTRVAVRVLRDAWRASAERAETAATNDPKTSEQWRAYGAAECLHACADELDPEKDAIFEPCELAILREKLRKAREALTPFAYVADHDIGESETDNDIFRPMSGGHNIAPLLTVGDLRRARDAAAEIEKVLK